MADFKIETTKGNSISELICIKVEIGSLFNNYKVTKQLGYKSIFFFAGFDRDKSL